MYEKIKIPNLSDALQDSYHDLMEDLDWTIGEYSFKYRVNIAEDTDDYAQLEVIVIDDARDDLTYNLNFRIYDKKRQPIMINRYEDIWDEQSRENIWMMLFFEASKKI